MCLKVQEARQSDTRFNERRNITKFSFERNMKSAAYSIYSANRFELLNCETMENDENDHPYHKDTSIVGIVTINYHSRYKQSKRPEVVVNRFPENQHTFQKKCTVPGDKTYKEAATEKTNITHINVAFLGDSIISFRRGIKSEFNKTLRSGRERFKHLPGASSKDLLHYIDPTLEEQNFEAAIIHTGINDILYDSSSTQINLLLQIIKEIGKKYKSYKVKYVFISSLTFKTRISHRLLNEVNEMIERVCLENGYYYTENGNVYENDLFKDGLHLQNSGKKILSHNFIANLQTCGTFLEKTNMVPKYRSARDWLMRLVRLVSQIYKCYYMI